MSTTTEQSKTELAPSAKNGQLANKDKDYAAIVQKRIQEFTRSGQLHLPSDYSPDNAVKSAWLALQDVKDRDGRAALAVCDNHSIYNSLLDMVVQGLNVSRKQGYFIVYGAKLTFQRSYFGDMALAQRVVPGLQFHYAVVYKGDEFIYQIDRGQVRIDTHKQKLENVDPAKIIAAYCVAEGPDGKIVNSGVMPIERIRKSWGMSKTYKADGKSGTHHDFADEMALRTVIRHVCKPIINGSSDELLMESIRRSEMDAVEAEVAEDAATYGNGEVIDLPAEQTPEATAAQETEDAEQTEEQPTLETAGTAEPGY